MCPYSLSVISNCIIIPFTMYLSMCMCNMCPVVILVLIYVKCISKRIVDWLRTTRNELISYKMDKSKSIWVLVTEALLSLKYKTIRETNCLREHGLSDLLLLCLPKLEWTIFSWLILWTTHLSIKLWADGISHAKWKADIIFPQLNWSYNNRLFSSQ